MNAPTGPHHGGEADPAPSARQRRLRLLQLVRDEGSLDVSRLHDLLGASFDTVRRDLRVLEGQRLVRRGYGRVFAVERGAFETSLAMRQQINPEEKRRIADAVIPKIGEAQIIYLDEGYQTELIAERLPEERELTIVTPSLPIAALLAPRANVQVIVLAGRVRGNTLGVTDTWAADMLSRLNLDLSFIGANGVSLTSGLTTQDPAVAVVKSAAVARSARSIFVGAHHKFGSSTFITFAGLRDFELMMTGHELKPALADELVAAGARLALV